MNLKSRKLITLVCGVILLIIKTISPDLADLDTTALVALIGSYLVGQGIADHGKEKTGDE